MFESKQRTFAGKMTWILCVASLLVFCFIYTLTVWSVAKSIPEYESRTTTARAKYYLSKVENVLNVTQAIVESHERIFRENIDNPDKMEEVLYDFFTDNRFCEAFICVSPGFGHTTKKGLMIDVIRDASGIPIKRAREDSYDFRQHAYFQVPFKEKHNYWNEPYYVQGVPIMTFSHPLMDDKGNVMAVYGVDVNLQIMADTLMAQNAKSKGELLIKLMSRNGRYIVHENRSMIAHHTFLDEVCDDEDDDYEEACINALSGKDSTLIMKYNGERQLMTYTSVPRLGWALAIHKPFRYLYEDLFWGVIVTFVIMGLGLMLMVPIIRYVVHRMTKNISEYAKAAENIARGDFDTPVIHTHTNDEIQQLGDSLDNMRISLNDYMQRLEITTAERKTIENELLIANRIQMSMLPHIFPTPPASPYVGVYAYLQPAKSVGGDLYDFILNDNKFHFIVGDVSGKGVPASLIMAITSSLFRALLRSTNSTHEVVQRINNAISQNNERNMFVTLIVGELDLDTGRLEFCNAGHNPMLRLSNGEPSIVEMEKNLPVGLMYDWQFKSNEITLAPNERLLLYTDGVVEAENIKKELYGIERLCETMKQSEQVSSRGLVTHIKEDIELFTNGAEQSDDITIMSVRYKPLSENMLVSKEIVFTNKMEEVTRIAQFVDEVCEQLQLDFATTSSIQLAIEEAVVNVIEYAYPDKTGEKSSLMMSAQPGKIIFLLSDSGVEFDPTVTEEPDITLSAEERPIGGLGIMLVKKIMNEVTYQRIDGLNTLRMVKNIR